VWKHLYTSEDFLELRCSLVAQGFRVYDHERLLCAFLEWSEDCQLPTCGAEGNRKDNYQH